jgi:hypothetical protein
MKKWLDEEFKLSIEYLNSGLTYNEIASLLNRTKKSVRIKLNKFGFYVKPKIYTTIKKCIHCDINFTSLIIDNRKYCSQSCSAKENNRLYIKKPKKINDKLNDSCTLNNKLNSSCNCLNCGLQLNNSSKLYCNQNCFHDFYKKKITNLINDGDTSLNSRNYKKYLIEKYGNKCMECGWGEKNPKSNTIPIELEHIDGNSDNNNLDNLKLLCPNCHSLTPTYKGANRGNGRYYRKERYYEGKSY